MARGAAAKSRALDPSRMQHRPGAAPPEAQSAEPAEPIQTDNTEPAETTQAVETGRRMGRPRGRERTVLTLRPDAESVTRLRVYAAQYGLHMSDVFDALIALHLDDADVLARLQTPRE